jgi:ABC-type Co2+ transport system permease subunit
MLFAVHISDGVLQPPWLLGGVAAAALLVLASLWRLRDDEVPRIALLTAAFFIVSLMHIRVGPTSVHLLFNGLIGVLLGWRAALAIACGLFLQFFYIGHGGVYTLGVNTCVLTLPALGAWLLFRAAHRLPALRSSLGQSLLVALCSFAWVLSLVFSVTLLATNSWPAAALVTTGAWERTWSPTAIMAALLVALAAAALERRLQNVPEFSLGLLIGMLSVLASVGLNCAVLLLGGEQHWPTPPLLLLVAHLPIAVFEGIVLGFTLGFVAQVKPEMLGRSNGSPPLRGGMSAAKMSAAETSAAETSAAERRATMGAETPRPAAPPIAPTPG